LIHPLLDYVVFSDPLYLSNIKMIGRTITISFINLINFKFVVF